MDLADTISDDREGSASAPTLPTLPTLPAAPVLPAATSADAVVATSVSLPPLRPNPAANAAYGVMPGRPRAGEPSQATLRAAELRRRAKKRRRVKRIAMLAVAIVIGVMAGPPTARWIADGLDQAGSTETETPPASD